ncbi:hypothetical protein [Flagellimonas sp. 2504JD4-2]
MKYRLTVLNALGIVIFLFAIITYIVGIEDVWSDFIYLLMIPVIIGIFVLDYLIQCIFYYIKKKNGKNAK